MNLQILSMEGQLYLVRTIDDNGAQLLCDRQKNPRRFHCLEEIRDYFHSQKIDEVWLEQMTPYEEMCGLDDDTEPLRIPLNW